MKNIIRLKTNDTSFLQVENVSLGKDNAGKPINSLCVELDVENGNTCDYKINYRRVGTTPVYSCECPKEDVENNIAYLTMDNSFLSGSIGDIELQVLRKTEGTTEFVSIIDLVISQTQELTDTTNWFLKNTDDTLWLTISLQNNDADMVYPVGSVYVRDKNVNPSDLYSGTWELVDKEFKNSRITDDGTSAIFVPSANVASYQVYGIRAGHTMTLRFRLVPSASLNDTTSANGTFDLSKLGISSFAYGFFEILGASDGGNAIVMARIEADTGDFHTTDVIGKSATSIAANSIIYFDYTRTLLTEHMLDNFCDKFYFKRVA